MLLSQPGDITVSRRSMIARLLGFGAAAAVGKTGLAAVAPHLAEQWNFGPLSPDWQPLEVATGDTLLVNARVAGSPVEAVLDSGSGASIIDVSLAQTLGMANGERRTISGLGGKAPVRLIRDVDVLFGNQTRRLPFAVVADLGALSAAFGRRINMLLGADTRKPHRCSEWLPHRCGLHTRGALALALHAIRNGHKTQGSGRS